MFQDVSNQEEEEARRPTRQFDVLFLWLLVAAAIAAAIYHDVTTSNYNDVKRTRQRGTRYPGST